MWQHRPTEMKADNDVDTPSRMTIYNYIDSEVWQQCNYSIKLLKFPFVMKSEKTPKFILINIYISLYISRWSLATLHSNGINGTNYSSMLRDCLNNGHCFKSFSFCAEVWQRCSQLWSAVSITASHCAAPDALLPHFPPSPPPALLTD